MHLSKKLLRFTLLAVLCRTGFSANYAARLRHEGWLTAFNAQPIPVIPCDANGAACFQIGGLYGLNLENFDACCVDPTPDRDSKYCIKDPNKKHHYFDPKNSSGLIISLLGGQGITTAQPRTVIPRLARQPTATPIPGIGPSGSARAPPQGVPRQTTAEVQTELAECKSGVEEYSGFTSFRQNLANLIHEFRHHKDTYLKMMQHCKNHKKCTHVTLEASIAIRDALKFKNERFSLVFSPLIASLQDSVARYETIQETLTGVKDPMWITVVKLIGNVTLIAMKIIHCTAEVDMAHGFMKAVRAITDATDDVMDAADLTFENIAKPATQYVVPQKWKDKLGVWWTKLVSGQDAVIKKDFLKLDSAVDALWDFFQLNDDFYQFTGVPKFVTDMMEHFEKTFETARTTPPGSEFKVLCEGWQHPLHIVRLGLTEELTKRLFKSRDEHAAKIRELRSDLDLREKRIVLQECLIEGRVEALETRLAALEPPRPENEVDPAKLGRRRRLTSRLDKASKRAGI